MNKQIFFFFILIFISVSLFNISNAQIISKSSKQILLKGTVKDMYDDSPITVNIKFEDDKGKSFKIVSNSLTGKFEQILEANKTYKIRITSNNIFPTDFSITTDTTDNYKEQIQDFKVVKLSNGRKILCWDIFEKGTSKLKSNFSEYINELNKNMQFNRNVSLFLEVNAFDSFDKFWKINKGKLKNKKADTLFDQNDYLLLVQERFNILNSQVLNLFKYPNKIEIKKNTTIPEKNPVGNCNVDLIVKEFKELIGE